MYSKLGFIQLSWLRVLYVAHPTVAACPRYSFLTVKWSWNDGLETVPLQRRQVAKLWCHNSDIGQSQSNIDSDNLGITTAGRYQMNLFCKKKQTSVAYSR